MATELDTKLRPKVAALLTDKGQDATFKVVTSGGAYDRTTGETSAEVISVKTAKISPPSGYKIDYIDGTVVQAGDMKFLLAALNLDWEPIIGMIVTVESKQWTVVNVQKLYSGEQIAAYKLQVRR